LIENSLLLLPLLVLASLGVLLLSWLVPKLWKLFRTHILRYQPIALEDDDEDEPEPVRYMPSAGLWSDFRAHVRSFKDTGSVLFALEIVRTLALGALLGLTIYAAIQAEPPINAFKKKKHHHKNKVSDYSSLEWGEFGACAYYVSRRWTR
jgi:hypothetical protein